MSDVTSRFIGHKAGMQRALAEVDPGDEAVLVIRKDGQNHVFACGNGADSAVIVMGLLAYGQSFVYAGTQDEQEDQ